MLEQRMLQGRGTKSTGKLDAQDLLPRDSPRLHCCTLTREWAKSELSGRSSAKFLRTLSVATVKSYLLIAYGHSGRPDELGRVGAKTGPRCSRKPLPSRPLAHKGNDPGSPAKTDVANTRF